MRLFHKTLITTFEGLFADRDYDRNLCCSTDQCEKLIDYGDIVVIFKDKDYTGEYSESDIDGGWGNWDEMRPDNLNIEDDIEGFLLDSKIAAVLNYGLENSVDFSDHDQCDVDDDFPVEIAETINWLYEEKDMDLDSINYLYSTPLFDETGEPLYSTTTDEFYNL